VKRFLSQISRLLSLLGLLAFLAPLRAAEPAPVSAEAAAKKAAEDQRIDALYQQRVATLSPERQAWEKILQDNLGNAFYLPIHKRDFVKGTSTAWDFVVDDPKLPRVLLIGDSVSRGYTLAVRAALAGKANVHRAPENCGPTANGLKKLETWLASAGPGILTRLQSTGAKLVWASTTPIPDDPAKKQSAASIVERNTAAAAVMAKHGVAIDDLFTAITPQLATLQNPNDVHFTSAGYVFLGDQVAASIRPLLRTTTP
jgi:hypothetical protein